MSKDEAARRLTRGLQQKLDEAGLAAKILITELDIFRWLESDGGFGGSSSPAVTSSESTTGHGESSGAANGILTSMGTSRSEEPEVNSEVHEVPSEVHLEERSTTESLCTPLGKRETAEKSLQTAKSKKPWQRVWAAWLALRQQDPETEIPKTQRQKLLDRLAYGFTAEDLIEVLRIVHANPSLANRKYITSLVPVLASDAKVCKILGRPYTAPTRDTWITPFDAIWKQYYDSELEFGIFARNVRPVIGRLGEPVALAEFEAYLKQTPLEYLSWPKFAAGASATRGWQTKSRPPGRRGQSFPGALDGVW